MIFLSLIHEVGTITFFFSIKFEALHRKVFFSSLMILLFSFVHAHSGSKGHSMEKNPLGLSFDCSVLIHLLVFLQS